MSEEAAPPDAGTTTLPEAYQRALIETVVDLDVVTELVRRNLQDEDVRRILQKLGSTERDDFIARLSALLRKTSALLLISRQLSDSLFVDVLLPRLVELMSEFLDAERCSVFLYDRRTGELFTKVAVGLAGEVRIRSERGIAGAVFTSGEPLLIPDAYADARFDATIDEQTGFRTRDLLCVPLKHTRGGRTEIVGVAQVLNKRHRTFDEEDVKLLEALSAPAATALANAMLHEEVRRARSEESQLIEVSAAVSREADLKPLLGRIVSAAATILDAERLTLFVREPRTGELWTLPADGTPVPAGPSELASGVLASGEPLTRPDALCRPVRGAEGEVMGVAEVHDKRGAPFTREDELHLEAFCVQASVALRNARLVDELSLTIAHLRSLLEASKALSGAADLDSQLQVVLTQARTVMEAERSRIFVFDEGRGELVGRGPEGTAGPAVRLPLGHGFPGEAALRGTLVNVVEAEGDVRTLLCAPMFTHDGRLIGVLEVANKRRGPFTAQDEALMEAFASHAAVALDRARLVAAYVEKERFDHGLRLAHDIQMGMLTRAFPASEAFDLFARLVPARSVGGDLYDFVVKDSRLWFVVGDVSGKGMGAALFMTMAKTLLRAAMGGTLAPGALLERVNRELVRDNERGLFVTTFVACLDLESGALQFANAGHNPPYRLSTTGAVRPVVGGLGVPLGLLEDPSYETATAVLEPGEALFLYTDGVTEALNAAGEELGEARVEGVLAGAGPAPARDLVEQVFAAVRSFAGPAPQSDDVTAMALRFRPRPGA